MHDDPMPERPAAARPKPQPLSKEERLAQALRANLNRRKELARSKKARQTASGDPHHEET